jgi:hypothetical protein
VTRQSLLAPGRFLPGVVQFEFAQVIDRHDILNSRRSAALTTAQGTGQSAERRGRRARKVARHGKKRLGCRPVACDERQLSVLISEP